MTVLLWFCRALVSLLPQEDAKAELRKLCQSLVAGLKLPKPGKEVHLAAALQSISAIGRLAPEIFAAHANAVAAFVFETLLEADIVGGKASKVGLFCPIAPD